MRLLFLTSRLPFPPDRGDRLRVFNFIKHLSTEHEIVLASFIRSEKERVYSDRLSPYCRTVHLVRQGPLQSVLAVVRNVWRDIPLQALYYRSRAMRCKIDEIVASSSFDGVYVHLFRMAPYTAHLRSLYRIVDLTDAISREIQHSLSYRKGLSRFLYTFEQSRIERYERLVAEDCDEVWFISERDRRALARSSAHANTYVIPNGVDLDRFFPTPADVNPNELLFVGNMRVLHNIDAVRYLIQEILPRVQAHVPEVHLTIAGADPVRSITALRKKPAVTVTGFVPDLNRMLNQASVFVAPLRFGAGVQNKVVEAMAAGKPVVTTPIVNEGLGAVPGRDLLVGDDAAALAGHIVSLCRDPSQRRHLGVAARRFVTRHYRWSGVVDRMRAVQAVRQALSKGRGSSDN